MSLSAVFEELADGQAGVSSDAAKQDRRQATATVYAPTYSPDISGAPSSRIMATTSSRLSSSSSSVSP